jgi:hypothetical protein
MAGAYSGVGSQTDITNWRLYLILGAAQLPSVILKGFAAAFAFLTFNSVGGIVKSSADGICIIEPNIPTIVTT